jgi:RimJ/RimL family protein N-acetyltransferase
VTKKINANDDDSIVEYQRRYGTECFPRLFGALVNLRELSVNDAQAIARLMNYNISKYLYDVPDPYSIQDALYFVKKSRNDFESLSGLHFAIEYKGMSELKNNYPVLVGSIGLKNMDLINKKADLGYWIGEEYWGRGIASECVGLIIDYAFYSSDLGLREIIAYVFPENKASIRVLEKNGMKKKGEVNEYHKISKTNRTSLQYTITKNDRGSN